MSVESRPRGAPAGGIFVWFIGDSLAASGAPPPPSHRPRNFSTRPACFSARIPALGRDRTARPRIATKKRATRNQPPLVPRLRSEACKTRGDVQMSKIPVIAATFATLLISTAGAQAARGAPNTAAEGEEPIAGSIPSPNAWPRFPGPAVSAPEINSESRPRPPRTELLSAGVRRQSWAPLATQISLRPCGRRVPAPARLSRRCLSHRSRTVRRPRFPCATCPSRPRTR